MLHCTCGFTCGTRSALDKHFIKFADSGTEHVLDTRPPFRPTKSVGFSSTCPLPLPDSALRSRSIDDDSGRHSRNESDSEMSMSTCSARTPMSATTPMSVYSTKTEPALPRPDSRDSRDSRSVFVRAGSSSLFGNATNSAASGAQRLRAATTVSAADGQGMKVRLLIVRHAQSANKQRQPGQKASADPDLTDLGYEQAHAVCKRLQRDFTPEVLRKTPLTVISSPMRRCLLTIQPTVQKLQLGKDSCFCHSSFYEFGCAGLDRRSSTPDDISYSFPEFSPIGFSPCGQWDYRGNSPKETEQECKERCHRLAEFLHYEVAEPLRARSAGTDAPTIVLAIHQSLADLLCQILVEGTAGNWTYGDITHKLANAAITEVFLNANFSASFGHKNDDTHNFSTWVSRRSVSTKTCAF